MNLKRISFLLICVLFLSMKNVLADPLRKFKSLSPEPAPMDVVLKGLDGDEIKLSDYKGKVILLNFWASWCMPCLAEMPSLNQLANLYKHDNFIVISVAKDEKGPISHKDLRKRGKFYQMHFALDAEKEGIFERLSVEGLPTTMVIDQEGMIVGKIVGGIDWTHEEVLNLMQKYIDGTPPPPTSIPLSEKIGGFFSKIRDGVNSLFKKTPPQEEKASEKTN